jgi:methylenetetrahydrofolate dehydrogenase (NADP+)/methenyltetrahydrofolate cyclohydrolase
MSALILDGRALASQLRHELRDRVGQLAAPGDPDAVDAGVPRLAILGDGYSEAAGLYAASLERAARSIGAATVLCSDPGMDEVARLNTDSSVTGILVAQPLAEPGLGRRLVEGIDPAKDVDGATPTSAGRLARGEPAMVPATALAVIALLEAHDIPIAGRRAVVVGRSAVVGRPVAALLLARDATVVVTHRATPDLAQETRRAELLVVAAGVPGLVRAEMVSRSAIVVDCGINTLAGGDIVGDVDFDAVAPLVTAISPVPGGVGPVTPMMVLRQLVEAAERVAIS